MRHNYETISPGYTHWYFSIENFTIFYSIIKQIKNKTNHWKDQKNLQDIHDTTPWYVMDSRLKMAVDADIEKWVGFVKWNDADNKKIDRKKNDDWVML